MRVWTFWSFKWSTEKHFFSLLKDNNPKPIFNFFSSEKGWLQDGKNVACCISWLWVRVFWLKFVMGLLKFPEERAEKSAAKSHLHSRQQVLKWWCLFSWHEQQWGQVQTQWGTVICCWEKGPWRALASSPLYSSSSPCEERERERVCFQFKNKPQFHVTHKLRNLQIIN